MPTALAELCHFQEEHEVYDYAGDFIISQSAVTIYRHLTLGAAFAPIATDLTGGLIAFWSGGSDDLRTGELNSVPVVYISSEFVSNTVVCSDFKELLALLTYGISGLGIHVAEDTLSQTLELKVNEAKSESEEMYCDWYSENLQESSDSHAPAISIVNRAQKRYQAKFLDWCEMRSRQS